MNLIVLTPQRKVFEGEISSVKIPGITGQFEVLNNHAPMVSALGEGKVRIIEKGGTNKTFEIERGFIEVIKNEVALLVQGVKE